MVNLTSLSLETLRRMLKANDPNGDYDDEPDGMTEPLTKVEALAIIEGWREDLGEDVDIGEFLLRKIGG